MYNIWCWKILIIIFVEIWQSNIKPFDRRLRCIPTVKLQLKCDTFVRFLLLHDWECIFGAARFIFKFYRHLILPNLSHVRLTVNEGVGFCINSPGKNEMTRILINGFDSKYVKILYVICVRLLYLAVCANVRSYLKTSAVLQTAWTELEAFTTKCNAQINLGRL